MTHELGSGVRAALDLQKELAESFQSGQKVSVFLKLPRNLTGDEIRQVEAELKTKGIQLLEPVLMGKMTGWHYALRLQMLRPDMGLGSRGLPLSLIVQGALLEIGVDNLETWAVVAD